MSRRVRWLSLLVLPGLACLTPARAEEALSGGKVTVEILEGIPDKKSWDFPPSTAGGHYAEAAFGLVAVPRKFSPRGMTLDRSAPFLVRASGQVELPAGA